MTFYHGSVESLSSEAFETSLDLKPKTLRNLQKSRGPDPVTTLRALSSRWVYDFKHKGCIVKFPRRVHIHYYYGIKSPKP